MEKRRYKTKLCLETDTPLEKVNKLTEQIKNMLLKHEQILDDSIIVKFDEITDDGTIIYGVWECDGKNETIPGDPDESLFERFDDRIETGWWILDEISDFISRPAYFIERYPDGGIILEVTPL